MLRLLRGFVILLGGGVVLSLGTIGIQGQGGRSIRALGPVAVVANLPEGTTVTDMRVWGERLVWLQDDGESTSTHVSVQEGPLLPFDGRRVWTALATGPDGTLYALDFHASLSMIDSTGRDTLLFRVAPRPASFGVLSDGTVIVAAPAGGKLMHAFRRDGRWLRSFGEVKEFVTGPDQNSYLNRGVVVVNASDDIHYVYLDAPEPAFRTYGPTGRLVAEHRIEAPAVEAQLPAARRLLEAMRGTTSCTVGAIQIVRSATIDPTTGRLLLAVSGSRTVLDLSPDGTVSAEYAVPDLLPSETVEGVASGRAALYVRTRSRILRVPLPTAEPAQAMATMHRGIETARRLVVSAVRLPVAYAQLPCPSANETTCMALCPNSLDGDRDCWGTLTSMLSNRVLYDPSCSVTNQNKKCTASTWACNPQNGIRTQSSIALECPNCSPCSPGYTEDTGQCAPEGGWAEPDPNCLPPCCKIYNPSPILLDLSRNGITMSSLHEGVVFDFSGLGRFYRFSWPLDPGDDPWLAMDRNRDGQINSVAELFGNATRLSSGATARNGFELLADLDADANGIIDERDPAFADVLLWSDINRNGVSEPGEIRSVASAGVVYLSTHYRESKQTDEWGNRFRYVSRVRVRAAPPFRLSVDVFPSAEYLPPSEE